jgi:hypothetical protein
MIKTLKISEELHTRLKTHGSKNKLKLNEWVSELLDLNLTVPLLIDHLASCKDISYLKSELKKATDPLDIQKRKRQINLMLDVRIICAEVYLEKAKRWKYTQNE